MIDGWLSLLPAAVAIAFVMWRKEVVVALILAIVTSETLLVLAAGESSVVFGFFNAIERVVAVFSDAGNTRLLTFSMLIGVVLGFMQYSGGVSAMVNALIRTGVATTPRRAGLLTYFTGVIIFIESNLSVLTSGILSRGLFDRYKMSRERLAYIIDSTSAPICILIMLNGWGAFVLGIISAYPMQQSAVNILIATIPLNIYAISALMLAFYTVWTGKVFGPLAKTERYQNLTSVDSEPSSNNEYEPQANGKISDMLVPLLTIVGGMLFFMWWTGDGNIVDGSGSKSVLYATVLSVAVGYLLLIRQPRFKHRELVDQGFNGVSEVLPLVAILLLSIALGASVKELGTGVFISGIVAEHLPLFLVPAMVFIAGAFASFMTGTSWGTFALLVPIAMPMAIDLNLSPSLVLAAVLGGGIFGDHSSPVSDTTAVSSLAAGCDLLDHVRTQLPYALVCGAISILAYLGLGWFATI